MAVPQTLSFEDLQDILNVAAPTGISAPSITAAPPMLATPQTAGSSIAYIDRPSFTQAYSPENLPEFMRDFEQISPTLFAPSQGVFGQAPEVDTIQPLMPQQYVDEYADLERAFQESIALDPTMFGDMYRGGLYMPVQTLPSAPEDEPFDLAESLAAAEALRQIYPIAQEPLGEVEEAIKRGVIDPTEQFVQQKILEPTEEFVQQKMLDPAEDAFKAVADPVEEAVQQYALDPTEDVLKAPLQAAEKALEPVVEAIDIAIDTPEPIKKIEDVAKAIPKKLDELVQTPDVIKDFEDNAKSFLDTLPDATTNIVSTYADVENMIENPSGRNVDKAVQAINNVGFDAGATAPVVPPAVGEALSYAADIDAIINAFEDPDAESLTNAYVAADDLMATSGGLPAGEAIGEVATIFTGLEALDGGIESAAEAVNVVNAANAVASMAGVTTTSATGATSAGFLPAGFGTFFAAASLVKPITSAIKGGAAGTYARIQGDFDLKDGRFAVGGGVRAADTYRGVADKFAKETMNSGVSMANSLVDNYGFEIDEQALNAAPENIMKLQTSGYYNREGRAQYGSAVGSEDFVIKLIQNGVLKPTENTPPEILTSNEAFASFITDHLDKGRDEYAAKMYDITDGTGEEMITGGTRTRKRTVTSRASFATQEAAQSWADDNFEERYGKKSVKFGRGSVNRPHKFTTSYRIVPVEVGDRTRYELKKTTTAKEISKSEYAEATKPKPKPEPQLAYDPLDFLKGLDLSNIRLGPLF